MHRHNLVTLSGNIHVKIYNNLQDETNNTKKNRVYVCYKVTTEVAILNFGTYHETYTKRIGKLVVQQGCVRKSYNLERTPEKW